ncbi:MAG: DUF1893 domain-containing protein [Treponema sp.]|nr:DUF1893 domain-containing protein [Treponema sp.]
MLKIYDKEDKLIFSSESKWLYPIFEFENFLSDYAGDKSYFRAHDSAIGKAAAVLLIRLGVKKIHGDLTSKLAVNYLSGILGADAITWTELVERLMCQTESQLENLTDTEEMYYLLRQRAKLVLGLPVKVQGLNYKYGKIKNLSFELRSGGRLMVLGDNGSGKTSLLRMLAGIEKDYEGEILIGDKKLSDLEKYTIGYIPQFIEGNEDNFDLSVEEVVGLGLPPFTPAKERKELIDKALCRTGSCNLKGKSFSVLSGGEKQKISLSRCLAQKAKVLLLDEPTASLDSENREMVIEILKSLSISEIPTIIMVSHDKELKSLRGWEIINLE